MKNKIKTSLIAIAAVAALAFTPKAKTEMTYTMDSQKTTATWLATKVTGQHSGTISVAKGTLTGDGKTITGGTFELDMNSIANTDLTDAGYRQKLEGHIKSEDFFNVAKFPTALFNITSVVLKSGSDYTVTGKLTIKGISNEITFPAIIKLDGKAVVAIAKITVDRTKFDIKYGSKNFIEGIGDKAISDNFDLNVNLVAMAK
jgi:polyisoprenoid-binding protein YceI